SRPEPTSFSSQIFWSHVPPRSTAEISREPDERAPACPVSHTLDPTDNGLRETANRAALLAPDDRRRRSSAFAGHRFDPKRNTPWLFPAQFLRCSGRALQPHRSLTCRSTRQRARISLYWTTDRAPALCGNNRSLLRLFRAFSTPSRDRSWPRD